MRRRALTKQHLIKERKSIWNTLKTKASKTKKISKDEAKQLKDFMKGIKKE